MKEEGVANCQSPILYAIVRGCINIVRASSMFSVHTKVMSTDINFRTASPIVIKVVSGYSTVATIPRYNTCGD